MNTQELAKKAIAKFQTEDGTIVDVLFATSDGEFHYEVESAVNHAKKLEDKNVHTFYRDAPVRKMGEKFEKLQQMIVATDFIKLAKIMKRKPVYEDYLKTCKEINSQPIESDIFSFVVSKVFSTRRLVQSGQRDKIFTYDSGIVDAYFLRKFPQGIVWHTGERLVFTCPTHTELMGGTYEQIFQPLFQV